MPIYTYRCSKCNACLELIQSFSEGEAYVKEQQFVCPNPDCGSKDCERVIGPTSFVLKGNGWYAKGGY